MDAVFYLRHLIQLRLLRTGRLGPVAWLIAPWLPLGFCSCLFASWSVLCLALEGVLSRRSAGRDAVADLRLHTAPSYASQSRPASPSQPAAPRAPRLLGGGLRSDVALLDVCRLLSGMGAKLRGLWRAFAVRICSHVYPAVHGRSSRSLHKRLGI